MSIGRWLTEVLARPGTRREASTITVLIFLAALQRVQGAGRTLLQASFLVTRHPACHRTSVTLLSG